MSCEHCTDPDGEPCFPTYGLAPHTHSGVDGNPMLGKTTVLPQDQWPNNFREDPSAPGKGIWWCPVCGDGKPSDDE